MVWSQQFSSSNKGTTKYILFPPFSLSLYKKDFTRTISPMDRKKGRFNFQDFSQIRSMDRQRDRRQIDDDIWPQQKNNSLSVNYLLPVFQRTRVWYFIALYCVGLDFVGCNIYFLREVKRILCKKVFGNKLFFFFLLFWLVSGRKRCLLELYIMHMEQEQFEFIGWHWNWMWK